MINNFKIDFAIICGLAGEAQDDSRIVHIEIDHLFAYVSSQKIVVFFWILIFELNQMTLNSFHLNIIKYFFASQSQTIKNDIFFNVSQICFLSKNFGNELDPLLFKFLHKNMQEWLHIYLECCESSALDSSGIVQLNFILFVCRLELLSQYFKIIILELFISDIYHFHMFQHRIILFFLRKVVILFETQCRQFGMQVSIVAAIVIWKPEARRYLACNHLIIIFLSKMRNPISINVNFKLRIPLEKFVAVKKSNNTTSKYSNIIMTIFVNDLVGNINSFYSTSGSQ